ncbi:MAG TPA: metal-sensitive transcriptional regulator [Acidimicrobiales bacterium]|nr:metal-sensitive transcriptional regulator [Acidimicrobiales bacterium]
MQLPDEVIRDVRNRLHRVAGQLEGIERMLDEGRECRDVVTQISAANKALEQAGFRLVAAGLNYCVTNPEQAEDEGYPLEEVQRMFMKLA